MVDRTGRWAEEINPVPTNLQIQPNPACRVGNRRLAKIVACWICEGAGAEISSPPLLSGGYVPHPLHAEDEVVEEVDIEILSRAPEFTGHSYFIGGSD